MNDIVLLMHVAEHGGYSAAARALRVPKSTISERIASLERSVGTGLIRRTPRSFSLTEAGRALLPYSRAISESAKEAEQRIRGLENALSGTLRISTSNALAEFAVAPLLPVFLRQYRQITIEIDVQNAYVDLIGEGFDLCIRAHGQAMENSSLRQRVVARTSWSLAAAPAWCEGNVSVSAPEDLAHRDTLYFGNRSDRATWALRKGAVSRTVALTPRLFCRNMATLLRLAIGGAGVVALPTYIVTPALRAGQLTTILSDWRLPASTISILMPERRQSSPLAAAFTDFLAKELGA